MKILPLVLTLLTMSGCDFSIKTRPVYECPDDVKDKIVKAANDCIKDSADATSKVVSDLLKQQQALQDQQNLRSSELKVRDNNDTDTTEMCFSEIKAVYCKVVK